MRRSATQALARDDAAVALGVIYQHIEDVEAKGVFRLSLIAQNTKNGYMPSQGGGAYPQFQGTTIDRLQRVGIVYPQEKTSLVYVPIRDLILYLKEIVQ